MAYGVSVKQEDKSKAVKTRPMQSVEAMELLKVPLFVEVIGEPSTGKTHQSCLFPKPALFDTTPKGEGYTVLRKLYPQEWKKRYFRIMCFEDVRKALKYMKTNKAFYKTIIVDTAPGLRGFAAAEYLKELQKVKPSRKALMPVEYKGVNLKVNNLINMVTYPKGDYCMNLVFTAQMRDEWVGNKSTGRRIRDGHPKANFMCDIRLFLQIKQKVDQKTMQYIPNKFERTCRVVKCRFRNQVDENDWMPELKKLSWEGIKELSKLKVGEIVE